MEGKKKVLVIDDEEDLCFLIKENLEMTEKYEVVTLSDPTHAEKICQMEKPDIILLDVVMPHRKGSEVAEALKTDPATQHVPIVIMSGLGEMVYYKKKDQWKWLPNAPIVRDRGDVVDGRNPERAAKAYGVEHYISKPFSIETLLEVIEGILNNKKE